MPHVVRTSRGSCRVAEAGIGGDGGHHVPGHVDLRQHRHVALGGVGDDLAQVVRRVVAAVGLPVPRGRVAVVADGRLTAPRPHFGEAGVLGDRHPPALVVGQVEVEHIELVGGDEVEQPQEKALRHEVAGDVEVDAAPGKSRRI